MVRLVCGDSEWLISVEQAERVFKLQKEIGLTNWQLPVESPYHLVNGKLIKPGNTKIGTRKTEKKRN